MAIEILTGQEVPFLEAQGVASPEADRADAEVLAGSEERLPRRGAFAGRREELEPRLARVPGPRGEEGRPSIGNGGLPSRRRGGVRGRAGPPPLDFRWNRPRGRPPRRRRHEVEDRAGKRLHFGEIDGREPLEQLGRSRTLQREAQEIARAVGESHPRLCVGLQPRQDGGPRSGIADHEEPVRREARDDHVVEDRAVVPQHVRVPRAARRRRDVVRAEEVHERVGLAALDEDFAHVADVEKAEGLADREVLLHDARVLERHLPGGELDEPCPGLPMPFVEGRAGRHGTPQRADGLKAFSRQSLSRLPSLRRPPWAFSASSGTSSAP